jgi:hypothetical protein
MTQGPYVIKRLDQGGGYVAVSGSRNSYTHNIGNARAYISEAAAQADCCDNERAVSLFSELRGR